VSQLLAASDEQKVRRDALTWAAWGGLLQRDQYLARELCLRARAFCKGGMQTWLWVDPSGVLCSCETFSMASRLDGVASRSYAVASVFTEEPLRRRGHAVRMIDALAAEIRASDPGAHAIVLYSDVGEAIYGRSGFVGLPAFDIELPPVEGDPAEAVEGLIGDLDLPRLLPPAPPDDFFLLWPDAAQLDWHLERERFYARTLPRRRLGSDGLASPRKRPPVCGAWVGPTRLFWTADFKAESLRILLLTDPEPRALDLLLIAARRAAHSLGLARVSLWEDDTIAPLLAGLPGATRSPRDGAIPMILPLQPSLRPAHWRRRPRALWV